MILCQELSDRERSFLQKNELSQKYSLSRHTVRKALGILEQDGYVEAFHGRGTYCSENMRHIKNSKNIAVVTTYISDYIFPRLIQGMDNVLSESGYSIILKKHSKQQTERGQMSGGTSEERY